MAGEWTKGDQEADEQAVGGGEESAEAGRVGGEGEDQGWFGNGSSCSGARFEGEETDGS